MKVQLKAAPYLFPMPVQMIATYNEDGTIDIMNAAWGGILDNDLLVLSLDESHKTSANIKRNKAFTLSLGNVHYAKECDYLGIVSGNVDPKKAEKAGFHTEKSKNVNAPIIKELPLALECEVAKITNDEFGFLVYGRIKSVMVEKGAIDEKGQILIDALDPIMWNQIDSHYYTIGKEIGKGFQIGKEFIQK